MLAQSPVTFAANATRIPTDYVSAGGAMALADKIRSYWADKGEAVEVWIEPSLRCFAVRSDMVGGLPRRHEHP